MHGWNVVNMPYCFLSDSSTLLPHYLQCSRDRGLYQHHAVDLQACLPACYDAIFFPWVILYTFLSFFAHLCWFGGWGFGVGSEIGFLGLVFSVERLSGFFWGWGSVYIQE